MKKQLPDGVYIAIDQKLIEVSDYKESNPNARVAVKFSNYVVVISPKNSPGLNWNDAMKYCKDIDMRAGKRIEREIIRLYESEVEKTLAMLGHDPLPLYQWMEEYSSNSAWRYSGNSGYMGANNKNNTYYVRPVTAFQLDQPFEKMELSEIMSRTVRASDISEEEIRGKGKNTEIVAAKALFVITASEMGYNDTVIARFLGRCTCSVNHMKNYYKPSVTYEIIKFNFANQ